MKCPYCVETIKAEAKICRYCHSDLTFHASISTVAQRISSLEETVARMSAFLDTVKPMDQEVNLIVDPQASTRVRRFLPLTRIAARFVVGNLTAVRVEWKQMAAAVVLATVFCTLSTQIGLLLGQTYFVVPAQGDFVDGVRYSVTTLPAGLFSPGLVTIFPLAFGFYAALAWPRRNLRGYLLIVILGLITGILVWGSNAILGVLGGALGLPTSASASQVSIWYTGWDEMLRFWDYTFSTYFLSTALLFMAGGFLGHTLKPRKLSDRGPSWAYRLLDKFSRRDRAPNRLLVKAVSQLPAIGITALGILIKVLAPLLETAPQTLPLEFYKNLVP